MMTASAALGIALLSAFIGAAVSFFISNRLLQVNAARELLSEALTIQALEEAWIVQSHDETNSIRVKELPDLKESATDKKWWLRRVEVRAVLDEAHWNSPSKQPYGFVGTRRAWIVRNEIKGRRSGPTIEHYPALMSSRGREELCGWIERVRRAHAGLLRTLRDRDLEMLRPLLERLADKDIVENLSDGLTPESVRFLDEIRQRWAKRQF